MSTSALFLILLLAAPAAAASKRVVVRFAATDEERSALQSTLEEVLVAAGVTADLRARPTIDPREVVTRRVDDSAPLARIWIDSTGPAEVVVYVADRDWDRILIRLVPRDPNPAVNHEQVGQIVRFAVEALSEGATIGIGTQAARERLLSPEPETTPSQEAEAPSLPRPAPSPELRATLSLGATYELTAVSSDIPIGHGVGVLAGAQLPIRDLEAGFQMTALYRPLRLDSARVEARFDTLALRWSFVAKVPQTSPLRLRTTLGGGLDVVHVNPRDTATELDPSAARLVTFGIARGTLGGEYGLSDRSLLFGVLVAELELRDSRYVITQPENEEAVFDPFRLRPGIAMGVQFR